MQGSHCDICSHPFLVKPTPPLQTGNIPVGNIRVQVLVMELCEDIIGTILVFNNSLALVTKGQPGWQIIPAPNSYYRTSKTVY